MKWFVGVLLPVGCVLVYFHWVFGVVVLVAAAWAVPMVIKQIHDRRHPTGHSRAQENP
jgi:hypothetical protein